MSSDTPQVTTRADSNGEIYSCQNCSRVFSERRRYNQHLKTHTKPFRCEQCHRGFALRRDLTRHISTRHRVAQQRFSCTFARCHFSATRKDNLPQHMRTVHDQHPESRRNEPLPPPTVSQAPPGEPSFEADTCSIELDKIDGSAAIFSAAAAGNVALLKRLHESGADIFAVANDGSNTLHSAARAGHADATEYLMGLGVSSEETNRNYRTPVHEAALSGDWETLKIFIGDDTSAGNFNYHGYWYPSVPTCVLRSENHSSIRRLIRHCGQRIIDEGIDTILHRAATMKNATITSLLLSYTGIKVNERDGFGCAPIHYAARNENADILRHFLSHPDIEVNIESRSANGNFVRPLETAIKRGCEETVKLLLADERLQFRDGESWRLKELRTCLIFRRYRIAQMIIESDKVATDDIDYQLLRASIHGEEDKVSKMLSIKRPISSSLAYLDYLAPLNWAVAMGHSAVVKLYLSHPDTNVNLGRDARFHPIVIAAGNGDQEVVDMLPKHPRIDVKAGAPLDEAVKRTHFEIMEMLLCCPDIDPNRGVPLVEAVKKDHVQISSMLLDHPRTNVNQEDKLGRKPLHYAVQNGNISIVRKILTREYLPKVKVNTIWHYPTALDIAIKKNYTKIAELLQTYGAKTGAQLRASTGSPPQNTHTPPSQPCAIENEHDMQNTTQTSQLTGSG